MNDKKQESGNPTLKLVFLVIALLLCIVGYKFYKKDSPSKRSNNNNPKIENPVVTPREIVIFDGYTPCDPIIDCKARIETYGNPIYEEFTGSSIKFYFDGTNKDPGQPADAIAGPVHMTSANPNNPKVRVIIKKIP